MTHTDQHPLTTSGVMLALFAHLDSSYVLAILPPLLTLVGWYLDRRERLAMQAHRRAEKRDAKQDHHAPR